MKKMGTWICAALLAACVLLCAGCRDRDFDHDPPPGMGTLYVDNRTGDGMNVYLDGEVLGGVGRGKRRYFDLDPGMYRVALMADSSSRSYGGDVDILAGRRTIMDVAIDLDNYRLYDVFVYFD